MLVCITIRLYRASGNFREPSIKVFEIFRNTILKSIRKAIMSHFTNSHARVFILPVFYPGVLVSLVVNIAGGTKNRNRLDDESESSEKCIKFKKIKHNFL